MFRAKRGADGDQEQEVSTPEPAVDSGDRIKKLTELREQGILSEEEFAAEQRKLLGS